MEKYCLGTGDTAKRGLVYPVGVSLYVPTGLFKLTFQHSEFICFVIPATNTSESRIAALHNVKLTILLEVSLSPVL